MEKDTSKKDWDFLTIPDIVRMTKVSKGQIYRYIESGELKIYRFGKERGMRVLTKDFIEFIEKFKKK